MWRNDLTYIQRPDLGPTHDLHTCQPRAVLTVFCGRSYCVLCYNVHADCRIHSVVTMTQCYQPDHSVPGRRLAPTHPTTTIQSRSSSSSSRVVDGTQISRVPKNFPFPEKNFPNKNFQKVDLNSLATEALVT